MIKRNIQRLKNLLGKEQTKILETTFILMLPALVTKVTGMLYNLVTASVYGTEGPLAPLLKRFIIANTIPDLLTSVLMVGAVGAVIIPILISSREEGGEKKFYEVYSSILNATILVFVFISLLIIIFSYQIIDIPLNITNTQNSFTPAELDNIVNMMRVLILPQLVLGLSVFVSSGLNVYNRFIVPQLSPLFFNIGRIVALLIFIPMLDYSPWALVIGTYVGTMLHFIVQVPLFISLKIKYHFRIDFKDKYLKEILRLGLPRMLILGSDNLALSMNNFLAAAFSGGTQAFNFAKSLYLVIPSLFGYTFSYASYPTMSKLFYKNDTEKIKDVAHKTLNQIFFMALPFVIVLMVLRVPLTRLFFGLIPGTQLDLVGTYQVAWILLFFSFGLVFITARWFLFSMFYASRDTLVPALTSILSLTLVLLLSAAFTNLLSYTNSFAISAIDWNPAHFFTRSPEPTRAGVGGISLAISVAYTIEFFIMIIVFHKVKVKLDIRRFFSDLGKKFAASFVMFLFLYFTYQTWTIFSYLPDTASVTYVGSTTFNLLLLTMVTIIPGFLIYYLVCLFLKVEELRILRRLLNPILSFGGLRIK